MPWYPNINGPYGSNAQKSRCLTPFFSEPFVSHISDWTSLVYGYKKDCRGSHNYRAAHDPIDILERLFKLLETPRKGEYARLTFEKCGRALFSLELVLLCFLNVPDFHPLLFSLSLILNPF